MKRFKGILAMVRLMVTALYMRLKKGAWDNIIFEGKVTFEHWRNGVLLFTETGTNTFTTEGMAKLLNIMFHDISKAASHIWYVGIFKNNITPALADTGAKLGSGNAYGCLLYTSPSPRDS